jgi:hypothetical protein
MAAAARFCEFMMLAVAADTTIISNRTAAGIGRGNSSAAATQPCQHFPKIRVNCREDWNGDLWHKLVLNFLMRA